MNSDYDSGLMCDDEKLCISEEEVLDDDDWFIEEPLLPDLTLDLPTWEDETNNLFNDDMFYDNTMF